MVGKIEPSVIAPDVLSTSGYVKWNILNKKRFHLWDCPEDPCIQMNEKQLVSMWRDFLVMPPARMLQVII